MAQHSAALQKGTTTCVNSRDNRSVTGTSSSWISLDVRFAKPDIWWGASWAVVCGMVASGAFRWDLNSLLRFVLVLLLADPLFSQLCDLLFDRDWTLNSTTIEGVSGGAQFLPYSQDASPAHRLGRWVQACTLWWKRVMWPQVGTMLSGVLVSVCGVLLIGLTLAPPVLWLVFAGLIVAAIGLLIRPHWEEGARGLRAVTEVGVPWLAGCLTFGSVSLGAFVVAGLYVVIYWTSIRLLASRNHIAARTIPLALIGLVLMALAVGQPVIAVLLALVGIFPAWLSWHGVESGLLPQDILRRTRYFVLATVLLSALAVGLG